MERLLFLSIAFVASIVTLTSLNGHQNKDFAELALGINNTSSFAEFQGARVHCSVFPQVDECISEQIRRKPRQSVLWLGNSQLHAINQKKPDDLTAPHSLTIQARKMGVDVITLSQPNANFQEHLHLFEHTLKRTNLDVLIVPAVFDDTRETGIRSELLASDKKPTQQSSIFEPGRVQEVVEDRLNQVLSDQSEVWKSRAEFQNEIYVFLYRLRNFLFRIEPDSTRRLVPSRYYENMSAFEEILRLAKKSNVSVITYIAPIRSDVPLPYNDLEYSAFKSEIQNISLSEGATFQNFEKLIPARYWGEKKGTSIGVTQEIDFMHFQGKGHEILSKATWEALKAHNSDL